MVPRLRSAEDALSVIGLSLEPDTGVIALVDRPEPAQGLAIPVDGNDGSTEVVDRLDEVILKALDSEPDCRMVLAARREPGLTVIDEADLALWRKLKARHRRAEVPLVDWFLLAGSEALSLAELTGTPVRWAA